MSLRAALRQPISGSPWATKLVVILSLVLILQLIAQEFMAVLSSPKRSSILLSLLASSSAGSAQSVAVDLAWHAPSQSAINNLTAVLGSSGVYGFIFNSSQTPDAQYGAYNWCNMPHVRRQEYVRPPPEYELRYVELVYLLPGAGRDVWTQKARP